MRSWILPARTRLFCCWISLIFRGIFPFLALIRGKGNEKKTKASGMPANLAGYLTFSLLDLPFSAVRVGAQKHTPHKRPDRGDLIYLWVGVFIPAGYMWGVCNTPLPYRPTGATSVHSPLLENISRANDPKAPPSENILRANDPKAPLLGKHFGGR